MRAFLLSVCLGFASSAVAAAQPTTDQPPVRLDDAARAAFDAGQAAFNRGEFEDALTAFTSSYELSGRPELLFNIGTCHARLQQSEEALSFFERFLEARPDTDNRAFVEAQIARMRRAADPETDDEEITTTTPPREADAPSRAPAWIAFGVGAAGAITFAVAGALALGSHDTLALCRPTASCEAGESDRGQRRALVADVGMGTAIAGGVIGLILWFLTNPESDDDESSPEIVAEASPDGGIVRVRGAF